MSPEFKLPLADDTLSSKMEEDYVKRSFKGNAVPEGFHKTGEFNLKKDKIKYSDRIRYSEMQSLELDSRSQNKYIPFAEFSDSIEINTQNQAIINNTTSTVLTRAGLCRKLETFSGRYYTAALDIKNFWGINTASGFDTGDAAIVIISKLLSRFSTDALCSAPGGDEFMIAAKTENEINKIIGFVNKALSHIKVNMRDKTTGKDTFESLELTGGIREAIHVDEKDKEPILFNFETELLKRRHNEDDDTFKFGQKILSDLENYFNTIPDDESGRSILLAAAQKIYFETNSVGVSYRDLMNLDVQSLKFFIGTIASHKVFIKNIITEVGKTDALEQFASKHRYNLPIEAQSNAMYNLFNSYLQRIKKHVSPNLVLQAYFSRHISELQDSNDELDIFTDESKRFLDKKKVDAFLDFHYNFTNNIPYIYRPLHQQPAAQEKNVAVSMRGEKYTGAKEIVLENIDMVISIDPKAKVPNSISYLLGDMEITLSANQIEQSLKKCFGETISIGRVISGPVTTICISGSNPNENYKKRFIEFLKGEAQTLGSNIGPVQKTGLTDASGYVSETTFTTSVALSNNAHLSIDAGGDKTDIVCTLGDTSNTPNEGYKYRGTSHEQASDIRSVEILLDNLYEMIRTETPPLYIIKDIIKKGLIGGDTLTKHEGYSAGHKVSFSEYMVLGNFMGWNNRRSKILELALKIFNKRMEFQESFTSVDIDIIERTRRDNKAILEILQFAQKAEGFDTTKPEDRANPTKNKHVTSSS